MNKRQYRVGYHEIFPKVPLIINAVNDHWDLWCLSKTVASGHEQRKPAGLLLGVWYWGPQSNSAHCSWLCQLCGGPGGHWATLLQSSWRSRREGHGGLSWDARISGETWCNYQKEPLLIWKAGRRHSETRGFQGICWSEHLISPCTSWGRDIVPYFR